MTALPGQTNTTTDVTSASPASWPAWTPSRGVIPAIASSGPMEALRREPVPPVDDDLGFAAGAYQEVDVTLDRRNKILWCYLRPHAVPNFTHGILRELADIQRSVKRRLHDVSVRQEVPIHYVVVGSRLPGVFNMGGDLGFFADCIRAGDRAALENYARACIEVVYNNATALDSPIVTVALVQGDALGGGFEAVLSFDVVVAEKSAKFGLPEILFHLFPGMGAYSLLSRKLDPARAERMILSGRIYSAAELHDMGLVEVVAEDGHGEDAVRHYIARHGRRHGAHSAVCAVRRRINPLTFQELQDVTKIWVDTALRLEEVDLRRMERLMLAQRSRLEAPANGGGGA